MTPPPRRLPWRWRRPPWIPLGHRVSVSSAPLVFDPLRGGVWTANGDVGSVSYADVDQATPWSARSPPGTTSDPSPSQPRRRVARPPSIAPVRRSSSSTLCARAVIRTIPTGTHPRAAVWDAADPRWLYVTLEDDGAIAVIDRTLGVLSSTIPVGRLPAGVAVSAERRELYVTHRIDGKVTIVPLLVDADAGIAEGEGGGTEDAGEDAADGGARAGLGSVYTRRQRTRRGRPKGGLPRARSR